MAGILPEHLISKYGLSKAACNFSFNLISGKMFDVVYSTMPLYVTGKIDRFEDERFKLIYSPIRYLKYKVFAYLATIDEQVSIFFKIEKKSSVWFYNLTTLSFILFILLKVFKPSVKVQIIVLDFTPVTKGVGLNSLYLRLINKADGLIKLANSELFTVKNSAVLAGVVPRTTEFYPKIEHPNNQFLLSGVLSEAISQTKMVLEAFSKLPECELHITGFAQNDKEIRDYSEKYDNIIYHGSVNYEEYLRILHKCTFVLSTRNPLYSENQCNFPSKIIESLLHNRIVLSTISYSQLDSISYFVLKSNLNDFIIDIRKISSVPTSELLSRANQGEKIKSLFSTEEWCRQIRKIEGVK